MPTFEFTERDLNRGKIVPPAWYRVKIEDIGEAPSKDGQSTNYPVTGTILFNADNGDKTLASTPIEWMFNSKAIGFAVGFLQALGHEPVAGQRVDMNAAIGQQMDVFIENDLYQGRQVNRVNHKYRKPQV